MSFNNFVRHNQLWNKSMVPTDVNDRENDPHNTVDNPRDSSLIGGIVKIRRGRQSRKRRSRRSWSGHRWSSETSGEDEDGRAGKRGWAFRGREALRELDINYKSSFDVTVASDKFNSPSLESPHSSARTLLCLCDIRLPKDLLLLRLPRRRQRHPWIPRRWTTYLRVLVHHFRLKPLTIGHYSSYPFSCISSISSFVVIVFVLFPVPIIQRVPLIFLNFLCPRRWFRLTTCGQITTSCTCTWTCVTNGIVSFRQGRRLNLSSLSDCRLCCWDRFRNHYRPLATKDFFFVVIGTINL